MSENGVSLDADPSLFATPADDNGEDDAVRSYRPTLTINQIFDRLISLGSVLLDARDLAHDRVRLIVALPEGWSAYEDTPEYREIRNLNVKLVAYVDQVVALSRGIMDATASLDDRLGDRGGYSLYRLRTGELADCLAQARHDYDQIEDFPIALDYAFDLVRTLIATSQALKTSSAPAEKLQIAVAQPADRLIDATMRLLPAQHRSRYKDEFSAELYALAQANATRSIQVIYAMQQLSRVLQLRASLRAPNESPSYRLRRVACWVLASEIRTWGLLGPVMVAAVINVTLSQGWGSAFYTMPGVVAFYWGVEWLRTHWDIEVKRRTDRGRR
ncbi:hypothetical protein [Streptosporangium subroseum]|uniref:hypothetical protein n=1 Tax=Streptosporangium subroseum TaxID=106412 RepID=UPI003093D330|nr:hypothetical protein OHB15_26625 [Streptosporangium subroseum]